MPSPFNDRRTRAQCGRAAERQRTVTLPGDSAAWNGTARRSVPRAVLAAVSVLIFFKISPRGALLPTSTGEICDQGFKSGS